MAATAVEEALTAEVARELTDRELQDLAEGDGENAAVASDALAERSEQQEPRGQQPEPQDASRGDAATPQPDVDEMRVEGTVQLSMFNIGGKLPTGSTLALTGGQVELVNGQAFEKGDRIRLTIEAVVNDVGQKDHHDPKTGQVVSCTQRHKARIVDVQLDSKVV